VILPDLFFQFVFVIFVLVAVGRNHEELAYFFIQTHLVEDRIGPGMPGYFGRLGITPLKYQKTYKQ